MDTLFTQLEIIMKTSGIGVARIIVTAIGGVLLTNVICKFFTRVSVRSSFIESATAHFAISVLKISLYIAVGFSVASQLGVSTDSLVAELGIMTAALSLALKDTISSLANGILIVATKPFVQGDHVIVGGVDAQVKSISLLSTVVTTYDNQVITIPNHSVIGGNITNYSKMPTRRVTVVASAAYGSDVDEVKKILARVVQSTANVLKTPAPFIRMTNMGASSIDFTVRVWTYTDKYMGVMCDLNEGIYKAMNEAGVEIPFNQLDVHLRDLPTVEVKKGGMEDA